MCDLEVRHTPTGIRLGAKGPVANTPEKVAVLMTKLPKNAARRARKEMHRRGLVSLASVPRASVATA